MKVTKIVRWMDELGRVVVPREIREVLHIKEGDPFEVFVEDDKIVFRKYDTSAGKNEAVETLQRWLRNDPDDDTFTKAERMMLDLLLEKIAEKG